MRRGLIGWDEAEVPAAALDARMARLQAGMKSEALDAVLVYTNFPRPAAVSYLTHFVPYWSQSLLVTFPDGPPTLVSANTKRVAGWMAETSHLDDIACVGAIGPETAKLLKARVAKRIGVVEMAKLPGGIGVPIKSGLDGASFADATALFARIRHPADEAEIALSRKATRIANEALDAALGKAHLTTATLIAAIEGAARESGVEEIIIDVAPDLDCDTRLIRIEGELPLARFAVRVSTAYKGHWVRVTRSSGGPTELPLAAIAAGAVLPEGCTAEVTIGSAPLSPVAKLPAGSVASLAFTLDGPTLAGGPVLVPISGAVTPL